jgi:hypothetical protein
MALEAKSRATPAASGPSAPDVHRIGTNTIINYQPPAIGFPILSSSPRAALGTWQWIGRDWHPGLPPGHCAPVGACRDRPGGGVALIRSLKGLNNLEGANEDQTLGIAILRRAIER